MGPLLRVDPPHIEAQPRPARRCWSRCWRRRQHPRPGRTSEKHPRRLVLDAIFYLVGGGVAGCSCRGSSRRTGPVYGVFRRWVCDGSWRHIHDALCDLIRVYEGRDPAPSAAIIDSSSVRDADAVPPVTGGLPTSHCQASYTLRLT